MAPDEGDAEPAGWLESEGPLLSWRRELERLKRRARARLLRTLALTVVATMGAVYMASRRVPLSESRILIRVTEGNVLRQESPLQSGDLGEFLRDSAFSNPNLLAIIEKRKLYPFERVRGDKVAIDELRSSLGLDVYKNYFLTARNYNDPVRTARISIRFFHEDPAVSFAVAKDLAQLIIDSESRRREEASHDVASLAKSAMDAAIRLLEERQAQLNLTQMALTEARRRNRKEEVAELQVALARLTEDVKNEAKLVRDSRARKRRADLQYALDSGNIGMLFQIVDERPPPPPDEGRRIRLAMVGFVCFLILLPLCAVAIGAFDSRIHDLEDVQRLGLAVVGHVPRFGGSEVGSMRSRQDADRRRSPGRVT